MQTDYEYLAQSLSSLSGLPVRYYKGGRFVGLYHHTKFKPDLAILEEPNIFAKAGNVCYYMDGNLLCYGLLRAPDGVSMVIGPVTPMQIDRRTAANILLSIGEPQTRTDELMAYFASVPSYPLRNFLQILCTVNYFVNREKIDVGDLLIDTGERQPVGDPEAGKSTPQAVIHNTMDLEREMLSNVEFGRTDRMKQLFRAPTAGRPGQIAPNALRQQKNLIVCTATLVTRAAIRGGLDAETAFGLSDVYIQKAELINDYVALARLNAQMVMDFTERVERVRGGKNETRLTVDVRNYVLGHIGEPITTGDIAACLGINRTYLCKRFRDDSGVTVNRFILTVKTEEAKRLLRYDNKSLADVACCLGFSSQSHFQNTFRKLCGMTPKQYRESRTDG